MIFRRGVGVDVWWVVGGGLFYIENVFGGYKYRNVFFRNASNEIFLPGCLWVISLQQVYR